MKGSIVAAGEGDRDAARRAQAMGRLLIEQYRWRRPSRRERIPRVNSSKGECWRTHDKDRRVLHALGYAQELRRTMSGLSNFAISFTIISILSGTLTLYYQGLNYGGFVEEAYGWPLVSFFVLIVGLGMAEIASKYPTAGGLYYWSSKMGGPAWGWFTGWFNLIGQIAITAGIDYGAATFTDALLQLLWPGTFNGDSHEVIYVYAVILGLHALMNIFSVPGCATERHLRLVALPRRADHRGLSRLQAGSPSVGREGVLAHDQQQWLGARLALVRAAPRPVAGAVHLYGLRRLGPHERGDERRLAWSRSGHRHVDRGVRDLRLHPGSRGDLRDPGHRHDHWSRHVRGATGVHRVTGHDDGEGDALHHGGSAVLLRHVVDHLGFANDVRVLS
jgi:hypothetical protein